MKGRKINTFMNEPIEKETSLTYVYSLELSNYVCWQKVA